MKNWAERGFLEPIPLSVDQYAAADAFLSGKAAMLLCNTNEIYQLRNQPDYLPFNMDCFLIPAPKDCTESSLLMRAFMTDLLFGQIRLILMR